MCYDCSRQRRGNTDAGELDGVAGPAAAGRGGGRFFAHGPKWLANCLPLVGVISAADIAELHRLEREWITSNRCVPSHRAREAFESRLRAHASDLLAEAEAILKIKTVLGRLTPGALAWRIADILSDLDRAPPPARTDYAATLPHLDAGELAQSRQLLGHGRRTP